MQDLREVLIWNMEKYVYSWTVINHMKESREYLEWLKENDDKGSYTGNAYHIYPHIIPSYFAAAMGLKFDKLFFSILKEATKGESHVDDINSVYVSDDENEITIKIGRHSRTLEGTSTSCSDDIDYSPLVDLICAFARIAVYHHYDYQLLTVLEENPEHIMFLLEEGKRKMPSEHAFFERLKMIAESMISIKNPGWDLFDDNTIRTKEQ